MPSVADGINLSVDGKVLSDMVKGTIFAAAQNEGAKPILTGINISVEDNVLQLVAIDGYRLAIRKEKSSIGKEINFTVSNRALGEAVKLIDEETENIEINVGERLISFNINGYSFISRLLEGEFFNYKNAIPSESTTKARVNLTLILDSVERTSLLITSKIKRPVRCIFDDNTIRISSATSLGAATDKIPASIEGKRLEIGFNNTYLTDCLRTVDVDEVKIELSSPVSPIIVKPVEGDNFIFLIIPMRLKNENIG
jgi:DNA polymerase-3 subunit beta